MSDLAQMWQAAPPISRSIAAASLLLSFSTWSLHLVHPAALIWNPATLPTAPWRLLTPFLLTGQGISILLSPFFLFRYASDCEARFAHRGDFCVFLLLVCGGILLLNTFLFSGVLLQNALVVALAYYWTAFQPAAERVSFFVATVPVKTLPAVMLLVTFVQGGVPALLTDLTGVLSAHLYLFLTEIWPVYAGGPRVVWTPGWLHALLEPREEEETVAVQAVRRGSVVNVGSSSTGTGVVGRGGATASGSSVFGARKPDGWSHRGAGHKLGG